jgi:hypothetical protein
MKAVPKSALSLLLAATAMAGHIPAWAHATLQSASPAQGAEVALSPKEITLRFNEDLEPAFSNAKLIEGTGKEVGTRKATLDAADHSIMRLAAPVLAPGQYKVQYIAVGHDGHRRKGDYVFTVK